MVLYHTLAASYNLVNFIPVYKTIFKKTQCLEQSLIFGKVSIIQFSDKRTIDLSKFRPLDFLYNNLPIVLVENAPPLWNTNSLFNLVCLRFTLHQKEKVMDFKADVIFWSQWSKMWGEFRSGYNYNIVWLVSHLERIIVYINNRYP